MFPLHPKGWSFHKTDYMKIDDIIKDAEKAGVHWDDAIIELEWIDISESITGE